MDAIVIAIIGLIGVTVGALITNYFMHPKIKAETEKLASETWERLAEKMEARAEKLEVLNDKREQEMKLRVEKLESIVDKQEKKITRYGNRIIYLTKGIEVLVNQIIDDGKQPCWMPNNWNHEAEE